MAVAGALFEEVWIKEKQIVAIKPRPEFEPFFKLNYEEFVTLNNERATPGGFEPSDSIFFIQSSYDIWKKGSSSSLGLTATTCLSFTQISWKSWRENLFLYTLNMSHYQP